MAPPNRAPRAKPPPSIAQSTWNLLCAAREPSPKEAMSIGSDMASPMIAPRLNSAAVAVTAVNLEATTSIASTNFDIALTTAPKLAAHAITGSDAKPRNKPKMAANSCVLRSLTICSACFRIFSP
jgi:hypothetical protein